MQWCTLPASCLAGVLGAWHTVAAEIPWRLCGVQPELSLPGCPCSEGGSGCWQSRLCWRPYEETAAELCEPALWMLGSNFCRFGLRINIFFPVECPHWKFWSQPVVGSMCDFLPSSMSLSTLGATLVKGQKTAMGHSSTWKNQGSVDHIDLVLGSTSYPFGWGGVRSFFFAFTGLDHCGSKLLRASSSTTSATLTTSTATRTGTGWLEVGGSVRAGNDNPSLGSFFWNDSLLWSSVETRSIERLSISSFLLGREGPRLG